MYMNKFLILILISSCASFSPRKDVNIYYNNKVVIKKDVKDKIKEVITKVEDILKQKNQEGLSIYLGNKYIENNTVKEIPLYNSSYTLDKKIILYSEDIEDIDYRRLAHEIAHHILLTNQKYKHISNHPFYKETVPIMVEKILFPFKKEESCSSLYNRVSMDKIKYYSLIDEEELSKCCINNPSEKFCSWRKNKGFKKFYANFQYMMDNKIHYVGLPFINFLSELNENTPEDVFGIFIDGVLDKEKISGILGRLSSVRNYEFLYKKYKIGVIRSLSYN